MALSDDDKKEIAEIIAASKAPEKDPDQKEPIEPKPITKEAQEMADAEVKQKERESNIADSIKFNTSAVDFVKENIDCFGGKTGEKLLEILANNTKNESEIDRANEYRKNLMDQFIQEQKNLDILPKGSKEEIERYGRLTEAEKRNQSSKFWNVIESGIEIKKQMDKAKQIAIAKSTGSDTKTEIPKHIMVPKPKNA